MNSTVTSWAFGFGGWIGVLGGIFLFVTVPHNYTIMTLLLSPWLGGVGLYLVMYVTHAWINVTTQITKAMIQHDVIMALLTSFIGVLIVAIARLIIDLERGPRTPAEVAAAESAEDAQQGPPSPSAPSAGDTSQSGNDADDESGHVSKESESGDEESDDGTDDETSEDGEDEDGDDEEGEDEEGEDEEGEDEDGEDEDGEEDGEDEETSPLNQAAVIQNSEESSFENIRTPQLNAIPPTSSSPIPQIDDV